MTRSSRVALLLVLALTSGSLAAADTLVLAKDGQRPITADAFSLRLTGRAPCDGAGTPFPGRRERPAAASLDGSARGRHREAGIPVRRADPREGLEQRRSAVLDVGPPLVLLDPHRRAPGRVG